MPADFLEKYGLHALDLIAGLLGGLTAAVVVRQSNPWQIIGSVLVGAITANYLGGYVDILTGPTITREAGDFVVGLSAMVLCQKILDYVQKFELPWGRKNGNGSGGSK